MVDVLTGMRENMKFIFKANIEKETVKFTGYLIARLPKRFSL